MNTNVFTQNSAFYVMHNYTLCGVMLVKNEHIIAITLKEHVTCLRLGCSTFRLPFIIEQAFRVIEHLRTLANLKATNCYE